MGVNRMLVQQTDGLEVIKTLLTADPKSIIAAHEEARKQMQLTEEQQIKFEEAKEYIAKHSELATALKKEKDDLNISNKTSGTFGQITPTKWKLLVTPV